MKDWLQKQARRILVKHILEMVDVEDVLSIETFKDKDGRRQTRVMLSGQELDNPSKTLLREQANHFNDSFFWKLAKKNVKWQAVQRAFNEDDLKKGQDIVLTLRLIQEFTDDVQKKV